ncbi:hypothetical protein Trydic_g1817, partial [Trypoxylus dichotomus]
NYLLIGAYRWPGASLIVIRGHKHLHDCAYIGDDSSEELDEILEALSDGTYVHINSTREEQPSNIPHLMKRHRQDVEFHHPFHRNSTNTSALSQMLDTSEITDAKQLRKLLEIIKMKKEEEKPKPHVHVHRNSTIGEGETKNFRFKNPLDVSKTAKSQEVLEDVLTKLKDLGDKGSAVLDRINKQFRNGSGSREEIINMGARQYVKPPVIYDDNIDRARRRKRELILETAMGKSLNEHDEENDLGVEEVSS